jgi:hypothetical protein
MSIVTNGYFDATYISNNNFSEINKSSFISGWTYTDISGINYIELPPPTFTPKVTTYGNRPLICNGTGSSYQTNLPTTRQCFAMQQINISSGTQSIATISNSITLSEGSYNLNFRVLYRKVNYISGQSLSVEITNGTSIPLSITLSGSVSGKNKINIVDNSGNWTDNFKNSISYKSYDFTVTSSGTYYLIFKFRAWNNNFAFNTTLLLSDVIINSKTLPKPWAAYIAGHSKNTASILYDITGQNRNASITGTINNYDGSGNGASSSIPYIVGYAGTLNDETPGSGTQILWPAGSIPSNFTICAITRYYDNNYSYTYRRILSSSDSNFVFGHWWYNAGHCYYNNNFISQTSIANNSNWCVVCGTINSRVTKPNNILVNNDAVGITDFINNTNAATLSINVENIISNENSNFAFQQIIIWDTSFNVEQLSNVSNIQNTFLSTGKIKFPFKEVIYNPPTIVNIENYGLGGYKIYFTEGIISGITDSTFTYMYILDGISYDSRQTTSPISITGLQNKEYYVSLVIKSVPGNSSPSNTILKSAPYIQGTEPSNIVITPGLNTLKYSYTASSGGNPSTVKYYYSTASNTPLTSLGTGTTDVSFTITGLSLNQAYQYYIIAVGLSGTTEIWRNSVFAQPATPYIRGAALTNITITPGLNTLKYSYTASSGGNPSTVKYYYSTASDTPLTSL